jgi:hypothetical protein
MLEDRSDDGRGVPHLEKGGDMSPQYMQDELGQWHAYSYWQNHYVIGIGSSEAEALKRWAEALKAAQT